MIRAHPSPAHTPAPYFTDAEFGARLGAVRRRMAERGIELALVSSPENIFYLTGLDHWGYFAPHMLLVPMEGEPVLVTRQMENVTVANQVRNARFLGHSDAETVADVVVREVHSLGKPRRVGLEMWSTGLPFGLADALRRSLHDAEWLDLGGLIDDLRLIKSPAEQAFQRAAAAVTDAAAAAGIDAVHAGASEAEIAAACLAVMTEQGTYPGFGPFIRSTERLGEEHTTWSRKRISRGDSVFFELSGCIARYHAPLGRLVFVGKAPGTAHAMASITRDAFDAVVEALADGVLARDVYAAWQRVVDSAGLAHYRRHHCGYLVGIGMPPTWTGGNKVLGLRHDSDVMIRTGMSFHVLSWLMGTGRGDFFLSNTVLLGDGGPEVLTRTPMEVIVR
jgi:Xaa-Pro dipeptidase